MGKRDCIKRGSNRIITPGMFALLILMISVLFAFSGRPVFAEEATTEEQKHNEQEASSSEEHESDDNEQVPDAEKEDQGEEEQIPDADEQPTGADEQIPDADEQPQEADEQVPDADEQPTEADEEPQGEDAQIPDAEKESQSTLAEAPATNIAKEEPSLFSESAAKVARLYGNDRYETALKIADSVKKELGVEKFPNVIIACGTDFPDALSGSYLAKVKNAPILLINDNKAGEIAEYVSANLEEGGKVYILGGTGAVSKKIEKKFKGSQVVRLGGANRFETNLLILEEAGVQDEKSILVCSGLNYPDALAASATGKPIVLVGDKLTEAQKSFYENNSEKTSYIIGGKAVVSGSLGKEILTYGKASRVWGANRYETSLKVAQKFFKGDQDEIVLAYALNFADALAGGPLAIYKKAPLLLSTNSEIAYAYNYGVEKETKKVTILGGPTLVNKKAAANTQKKEEIFKIGSNSYYVKHDGMLAQNETFNIHEDMYVAKAGGAISKSKAEPAKGIDVSAWNGEIDWNKVKKSGIEFAFVRVGGRFGKTGIIYDDETAFYNLAGAIKAGIKVGAYFFTQAVTVKEAIEEAQYTINKVKKYDVTLPLVIDTEWLGGGRHDRISTTIRTKVVKAFCEKIKEEGYTPMIYSSRSWLNDNLDMSKLDYLVWAAEWGPKLQYDGDYICWQYTDSGRVNGISGKVDMNLWYGVL